MAIYHYLAISRILLGFGGDGFVSFDIDLHVNWVVSKKPLDFLQIKHKSKEWK